MIKNLRLVHFYLGVFFAPSIIFFSFSGALQTFSLHENHNGKPGIPWVTALSELHKNQRVPPRWTAEESTGARPVRTTAKPVDPTEAGQRNSSDKSAETRAEAKGGESTEVAKSPITPRPRPRPKSVPLKIFVCCMATGLIISSLLGIYMAFKYSRGPALIWGLLAVGTALPALLLYL